MTSRLSNLERVVLAVLAILCGAITEARAGTITTAQVIEGCGRNITIDLRGSPIEISKTFDKICNMDIVFSVTNNPNPGQDLDLSMLRESVFNDTDITWTDFHMQLGFGFGSGFTPVPATCGVGFATLPVPKSDSFTEPGVSSGAIDWRGGTVPDFRSVSFNFTLNVLDSSACIPVGSLQTGGYSFTLRQTPTTDTPEPTTTLLLGTGLAGVAIKTRKRFKKPKGRH